MLGPLARSQLLTSWIRRLANCVTAGAWIYYRSILMNSSITSLSPVHIGTNELLIRYIIGACLRQDFQRQRQKSCLMWQLADGRLPGHDGSFPPSADSEKRDKDVAEGGHVCSAHLAPRCKNAVVSAVFSAACSPVSRPSRSTGGETYLSTVLLNSYCFCLFVDCRRLNWHLGGRFYKMTTCGVRGISERCQCLAA